ncbi:MAG TPA: histidine phosphatase family protein [Ideonella sp.]|nr:histidine phosphatase family protein [Ideonella sp.]
MKILYLVRHAKSSKDDPRLPDRDRPLNERGMRDAPMMGERLAQRGVHPDAVISSPALRALTTAELVAKPLGIGPESIKIDNRLYEASPAVLLAVIRALDDARASAMLFGHNPEFTELAQRLSGGDIADMPTCAVAEFHFDTPTWSHLGEQPAGHVRVDSPKNS